MTATAPDPLTRQQLINLLSQHKQEEPVQDWWTYGWMW